MADVKPFSAVFFGHKSPDITSRTAPPYDVISPEQRADLLARDPHNVVALELPDGPLDSTVPGNRYETGARTWREWLASGVLERDSAPAIYVLEQEYVRGNDRIRRRAFVAAVGLVPFSDGVVLPHERTLPKALNDRLDLIRATAANLSPVFGLFADPAGETDPIFEDAMVGEPMLVATDADGVVARVWRLRSSDAIAAIEGSLADKRIFIADGHHRYTTALAYRDERRAAATDTAEAEARPDAPGYDYVLMALVNMDDPNLAVLPTHRVADAAGEFDPDAFWSGLERRFDLVELPPGHPSKALSTERRPAFLVKTRDGRVALARLRPDVDPATSIAIDASDAWKSLDVAVLQELVLHPLLGIHPDEPRTLERLHFVKDAHEALKAVGEHDVAFIMNPTRMDQLREVALGGEIMPQKSTYFYPKLPSGLLFRDLG